LISRIVLISPTNDRMSPRLLNPLLGKRRECDPVGDCALDHQQRRDRPALFAADWCR
jgi:hypothetical protein